MSDAVLTQLGRYRIVAELGRGAMGIVYRAEDPLLNRTVAIKTVIMSGDAAERADYEARFYQEAKAAGGLNHPNVVTIHDIGREGEIAYMAMELVEGVELREMMERAPVALAFALDIVAQVADGLAAAHERGVVHRDIKPGNIMIVRSRHAKVMDFGIARMRVSDVKTQTGAILGSPKYMSPEQLGGERTDHRSDIFSLGVVLYEMVVGESPFSATQLSELFYQIGTAPHRPPSSVKASLPTMFDLIIDKALAKRTDTRYQSATELAYDLRACAAGLVGQPMTSPSSIEATVRLDAGRSATAKIDFGEATTQPLAMEQSHKATAVTRATDGGAHLLLSRRFDSTQAVQRLTELAAVENGEVRTQTTGLATSSGSASTRPVATRIRIALLHLQQDAPQQAFVATVALAIVVALVIAFA